MSAPKRRGDAILAVMQAARAHRENPVSDGARPEFDEAHAIVERLVADGYLQFPVEAPEGAAA